MARPTTKEDLIKTAQEEFNKLESLIDSIPKEDRIKTFTFDISKRKEAHWKRDNNIRDILIHLYEWHGLIIKWVQSNLNDDEKPFIPLPYNWRTYGELNIQFWKSHQNTTFNEAYSMLKDSHKKVINLIESFNNEELFSKGVFKWSGGSVLGSYFVSSTSSHYVWAGKKIRLFKKQLGI